MDLHDFWLTTKATEIGITPTSGFAIVATGGLGRGELLPYSDLDLTLLHDNMPHDVVSQVAELLWYPLWDANIRIDHSVRTVTESLIEGEALVLIILLLLLGNFRGSLVTAAAIPFCMLVAFILMWYSGVSANLTSLGGLAISIGMMVDATVVPLRAAIAVRVSPVRTR